MIRQRRRQYQQKLPSSLLIEAPLSLVHFSYPAKRMGARSLVLVVISLTKIYDIVIFMVRRRSFPRQSLAPRLKLVTYILFASLPSAFLLFLRFSAARAERKVSGRSLSDSAHHRQLHICRRRCLFHLVAYRLT